MAMNEEKTSIGEKEGTNLLGAPTFTGLPNGRFKCVETGHEMLDKDKDSYSQSKRCRLGLIDYALCHKKTPMNMFKQDPLSRSKVICKLTGDSVNKNEEHIWKHINGKRFLNRLEMKESGKEPVVEVKGDNAEEKPKAKGKNKKKKKKNKKEKSVSEIISEVRDNDSELEEAEFWMPPDGDRWDFDDGDDRWGSGSGSGSESESESEHETGEEDGTVEDVGEELSVRTKRMSIEIGPSSFAPKKKKSKKETTTTA